MPVIPSRDPEPAPLFKRIAAFCYDLLLLAAVVFCFTLALLALRGGQAIAPGTAWFELCIVALVMAFFCGFWTHGGQTLGMRAWRIRVVTTDGQPLDWRRAVVRFWAAVLAALPAGLGWWVAARDPLGRGWHDRLSGTRVVRVSASSPRPAP